MYWAKEVQQDAYELFRQPNATPVITFTQKLIICSIPIEQPRLHLLRFSNLSQWKANGTYQPKPTKDEISWRWQTEANLFANLCIFGRNLSLVDKIGFQTNQNEIELTTHARSLVPICIAEPAFEVVKRIWFGQIKHLRQLLDLQDSKHIE